MITNKNESFSDIDFAAGEAILIDKNSGWTSFDVVNKIRFLIKVKKVGHAGTLDPAATGLLILCAGKMTKSIEKFQGMPKTYEGIITLGKRTESMDGETEIIEEKSLDGIDDERIEETRKLFVGEIIQLPPMYSAVKHKGKALYKYARKGKTVERKERNVTVYDFKILKVELPDIYFEIKSSKGTYIRAIADDFGKELGVGGYLKKLRRTKIGEYDVKDALTIKEFEERINSLT